MATIAELLDAAIALRDRLFALSDSAGPDRDVLADLHMRVNRATQAVQAGAGGNPAAALQKVNAALQVANGYPHGSNTITAVVSGVNGAVSALNALAGSAPQSFVEMLQGSLKVRGFVPAPGAVDLGGNSAGANQIEVPRTKSVPPAPPATPGPGGGQQQDSAEPYYKSLVKLFPTEAATAYPLASAIAGKDGQDLMLVLIGVLGLFVVVLRYVATRPSDGGKPDWMSIIVALVSFLLYAGSLGGFGEFIGAKTALLVSFVTILWVALVPHLVRANATAEG